MTSSNLINELSNKYCKYDNKCEKITTNHCQGCGQRFCMSHYSEHQNKLQEYVEYVIYTRDLVIQKWKSLISDLSMDGVLDLINQMYEYSLKLDEIEKKSNRIQQQVQNLIRESVIMTNGPESHYLENDIEPLKRDIEEFDLKLEEINNDIQKQVSGEQLNTVNMNVPSDNQSATIKSTPSNNGLSKNRCPVRFVVNDLRNNMKNESDDTPPVSHQRFKQPSSSISDLKENEHILTEIDNETHPEGEEEQEEDSNEEEMVVFLDSNTASKISHKVRFSNNIVRWLRGPFKSIVHGTMHAVDICAQGTHISDHILQVVKRGLHKQTSNNSIKPIFAEITSDWKLEGENPDRGYSSPSLWIRDPQGQHILIKIQEHPLCAANEWLAYVLGKELGLPVNTVQIAIYENNLVTLHVDVESEDEKTITFMDLPREKREALMTNPIMECMDIFDRIIQNVDRNQQNILITIPKAVDINDDDLTKLKIHLIDHSNSFGMGKLNGISLVAAKFHSNHLAVVKFDPIQKSKQFEDYLSKLPEEDRPLISKTLNRFASITNEQFDSWITDIQGLLSPSQYNRIYCVLRRQRDIAKRYTTQWSISSRSSNIKSSETEQIYLEDK